MTHFEIKNVPLPLSRLAAGCMSYGGKWTDTPLTAQCATETRVLVDAALESGINLFDHADIYARGKSEEAFGLVLGDAPALREQMIIQTKCGIRFANDPPGAPGRYDFSSSHIVASVEASLKRLQTDRIDILLLHRPDLLVEPEEVAAAFTRLSEDGKVLAFGVSNHTPAQIELLQHHLTVPIVVNQVQLSLLHTDLLDGGVSGSAPLGEPWGTAGTIEYCRRHGIRLQAWGPLAGGMLGGSKPRRGIPAERLERLMPVLREIADRRGQPAEALAIAWILRHPAGIQPVVGTRRVERLKMLCEATTIDLSREEWYTLFAAGRGGYLP